MLHSQRQLVSVWGSNHTHKGLFHTEEEGCFTLGSLCSILRVLAKGKLSREEAKMWEDEKVEWTDLSSVRARSDSAHYTPLTLTFLAFLHLTLFSREFSLSQNS